MDLASCMVAGPWAEHLQEGPGSRSGNGRQGWREGVGKAVTGSEEWGD